MAALTTQTILTEGYEPAYAAADVTGDTFIYSAGAFLHVKNGDASPRTVTVVSQYTAQPGISPDNIVVAIPAGEERMIGPFRREFFEDTATKNVEITYDAVTSVTVAVLSL